MIVGIYYAGYNLHVLKTKNATKTTAKAIQEYLIAISWGEGRI